MIYIFLVVFLYLFFGAALYFLQRKIVFNKSSRPRRPEDYGLENIKEITSSIVIESSRTYIKQKLDNKENINLISKSSNEIKSSIIK